MNLTLVKKLIEVKFFHQNAPKPFTQGEQEDTMELVIAKLFQQ